MDKEANKKLYRKMELAFQLINNMYNKKNNPRNTKIRHQNRVINLEFLYSVEYRHSLIPNKDRRDRVLRRKKGKF